MKKNLKCIYSGHTANIIFLPKAVKEIKKNALLFTTAVLPDTVAITMKEKCIPVQKIPRRLQALQKLQK